MIYVRKKKIGGLSRFLKKVHTTDTFIAIGHVKSVSQWARMSGDEVARGRALFTELR